MGFDPNRPYRASRVDYLVMGVALVACLGLLAWAVFG